MLPELQERRLLGRSRSWAGEPIKLPRFCDTLSFLPAYFCSSAPFVDYISAPTALFGPWSNWVEITSSRLDLSVRIVLAEIFLRKKYPW
jgi:hypothetical protein